MERLNKKFLPILILYILLVIFTVSAYIIRESNPSDNINSLVVTEVINPIEYNLVPKNVIQGSNDVYEVILNYNVKMSNGVLEVKDLDVKCVNIKIGNNEEYADLVNVSIQKTSYALKDEILVVVKVTLNEPENKEIYDVIKNQLISFDLIFTSIEYFEI